MSDGQVVALGFVISFALVSAAALIAKCINYAHESRRIPFKRFLSLRSVAPSKWDLDDATVTYRQGPDASWYDSPHFRFSLFDLVRYRLWLRRMRKEEAMEKENAELEEIIKSWQADIDAYKTALFVKGIEEEVRQL